MVSLFHFKKEEKTSRSLFIQTTTQMPIEIMVAIGKRHIVGIGEVDDKSATVEKTILPFFEKPTPDTVAKEILQKLGVPKSEWDEILQTKREIVL